jgi:hypothetical protein
MDVFVFHEVVMRKKNTPFILESSSQLGWHMVEAAWNHLRSYIQLSVGCEKLELLAFHPP